LSAPAISTQAELLARAADAATASSSNEATLRQRLEVAVEQSCRALALPWMPYELDRHLKSGSASRFVDVAHGGVVIEYEAPQSFRGSEGAKLRTAHRQAEEYAELLHAEEGRPLDEYILVAWDGAHIDFGRLGRAGRPTWEGLRPFSPATAADLLRAHDRQGTPLVHPHLIDALVGPQTDVGVELVTAFFDALTDVERDHARTQLLFTEWKRMFGQAAGVQTERLKTYLAHQERTHQRPYAQHPDAFLFALYSYVALVAKTVAALALKGATQDVSDPRVPIAARLEALESGALFEGAGITNMLEGDFFSWYREDDAGATFHRPIARIIDELRGMSFDLARKDARTTRDLFKGLYQTFVPGALRHALGEFYTPDALAAYALDRLGWTPEDELLDPTCGSGTFLLEALRRRRERYGDTRKSAAALLHGLAGFDLNPLAVLCARASLVVFLADRFSLDEPTRLPVYLADAVAAPERAAGDLMTYELMTEKGVRRFALPESLVRRDGFFDLFREIRGSLERGRDTETILARLDDRAPTTADERAALATTVANLAGLRDAGWDGIWCTILADRFAAAVAGPFSHVAGNPPWVKWSNLPPEYARLIKPRCERLGVFSDATWVGGIESDISTVITFETVRRRLRPGGRLAFYITGTVFANESSQGFRRFAVPNTDIEMSVIAVEDFSAVRPFEGVSNHPALLLLERDRATTYPVSYVRWDELDETGMPKAGERLQALPLPGTDAGPWLIGNGEEIGVWRKLFGERHPKYVARKGVTTDMNGVFWVRPGARDGQRIEVRNDPATIGRRRDLPTVTESVEREHVFPLLRGKDVGRFRASAAEDLVVLVPQRGLKGDPDLPDTAPSTYRYLKRFERFLAGRSSLKRYQASGPPWALWNVGPYSFSPYKVVWKEMSGRRFAAALIGPVDRHGLGAKPVICDHKLYSVAFETLDEAAYLTAFLNATSVTEAVNAYAARLSLGVGPVRYLDIPRYDPDNPAHVELSALGRELSGGQRAADVDAERDLTHAVAAVLAG